MMNGKAWRTRFGLPPGKRPDLDAIDPDQTAPGLDKAAARTETGRLGERLRDLQYRLYAEHRRSLLIVLQAMDAGGKDGTIRHVFGSMNPQGCRVAAFRQPTPEEQDHDFLWRVHRTTPARGEVAIFNRSHYEDVLVARVHGLVPRSIWQKRYARINDFEKLLHQHDTVILKFFLHISAEEQLKRFRKRLTDPRKQWKVSEADFRERRYWDDYMDAYTEAIERCNTRHAPWYVIPANHKWFRNLAVSHILVETLEALNLQLPLPRVDLATLRHQYLDATETGDS